MKKSILLLLPVLVLSGCNSGDKVKSVVEYLKDPKAMEADDGHCQATPAEANTIKCQNAGRAYSLATQSTFADCLTFTQDSDSKYKADLACIDRVAKELHMTP